MRVDPANHGVLLRRTFDQAAAAPQQAPVFVDGTAPTPSTAGGTTTSSFPPPPPPPPARARSPSADRARAGPRRPRRRRVRLRHDDPQVPGAHRRRSLGRAGPDGTERAGTVLVARPRGGQPPPCTWR